MAVSLVVSAGVLSGCVKAELSVRPAPEARFVDQEISFNGIARNAADKGRKITRYFDLDGDGLFEHNQGDGTIAVKTYGRPQTFRAGLYIRDNGGLLGSVANDYEDVTILARPKPPPLPDPPPLPPPPNTAPIAFLDATPNPAPAGSTIRFDASRSSDSDGRIVRYEFDLDGNGSFERVQTTPTASARFPNAGSPLVSLRVTDDDGASATMKVRLLIQPVNQPPIASFTAVRKPPPGNDMFLDIDGSASRDPDGQIVRYEWDFDGNGSIDETTFTPIPTTVVEYVPNRLIVLRVIDNAGASGSTSVRSAKASAIPDSGSSLTSAPRPDKPSKLRFRTTSARTVSPGTPMLAGRVLSLTGQTNAGRATFAGAPKELSLPRNAKWAARLDSTQNADTERFTGEGFMLINFPGEGSTCLSLSLTDNPGGRPRGDFQVIGGSGKARKLAGGGTFEIRGPGSDKPSIRARGATSVAKARAFPRGTCGSLKRLVRRSG